MFGIRNTRLLAAAFLLTVGFLLLARDWDGAGSTPPAPAADVEPMAPSSEGKSTRNSGDDSKRPMKPGDRGAPGTPDAQSPLVSQSAGCPSFEQYMRSRPGPPSEGMRQFPLVRPPPECRTFAAPAVEEYIAKMEQRIKDPDLYRLFQNSFPNTLDTRVRWHGYAKDASGAETAEELSYIASSDTEAMWLRDSALQLYSYQPFLVPGANEGLGSLNSLWRGLVNAHARAILAAPYCDAFQPPAESGIGPTENAAHRQNGTWPADDPAEVFDCKWQLDGLAAFLQASVGYWARTQDLAFFARHRWIAAVQAALDAATAMRVGTYDAEGRVQAGAAKHSGTGAGSPVKANGMVRAAFRPGGDATVFQLLVPTNMMWAKYLEEASVVMERLAVGAAPIAADKLAAAQGLVEPMRDAALHIRAGIDADAIVRHPAFGDVFAYEVDGYGGAALMDAAAEPSLLGMPLLQYTLPRFMVPRGTVKRSYVAIYQNTRRLALSPANPYWAQGPALAAVGAPRLGPGRAAPMAALVAAMTAFDAEMMLVDLQGKSASQASTALVELVAAQLGMVLNSTSGWGVVHESVDSWHESSFTRGGSGRANGLLGELVVRIEAWEDKNLKALLAGGGQGLLGRSWQ